MDTLVIFTILAGVFGMLFGSFINVVVFRTKEGRSFGGRSTCRACLEPIAAVDLIPIASYFALKGRCRRCSSVIEWQYPAVELVMGILFALFYARAMLSVGVPDYVAASEWMLLFVRDAAIATFLVIIFVYDFRYSYILDRFTVPAMIVALVCNALLGADMLNTLMAGLLIGGFFAVQFLVSQGKWIGGGDIRMGMLMGFLLGLELGVLALFLSYVFGAVIGIFLVATKKRDMKSQVPFGTFMSFAMITTLIWGDKILNWYLSFFG